jgi:hypothetical protein
MTDRDWFCSQPGCDKLHSEHVTERQTMTERNTLNDNWHVLAEEDVREAVIDWLRAKKGITVPANRAAPITAVVGIDEAYGMLGCAYITWPRADGEKADAK